ncbi:MAG: hypothetical protein K0U38_05945 [Epsilonproteobacteria bacterium]|nr:hypothetical protein [Campylobacterota bacterium]
MENFEKFTLRPSTVIGFASCERSWFNNFVKGVKSINSSKAMVGTAIHSAAEYYWTGCIKDNTKLDWNMSELQEYAMDCFLAGENVVYESGENEQTCKNKIFNGTSALFRDIIEYTDVPLKTEYRVTMPIEHPMIKDISGTIDYLGKDSIADIKTSGAKYQPKKAVVQQSIYKMLAEYNGYTVNNCTIQAVILLKNSTYGQVAEVQTNLGMAEALIESIKLKLHYYYNMKMEGKLSDEIIEDLLFAGNPGHYLCDDRFCPSRPTCKFASVSTQKIQCDFDLQ